MPIWRRLAGSDGGAGCGGMGISFRTRLVASRPSRVDFHRRRSENRVS
jgi:hypothetical protein